MLRSAWDKAILAIIHIQSLWKRTSRFHPYQKGDKVWLEGTHLHISYPTHKLCLKRFGPFEVMEVLSLIIYHLNLPLTWKLHNVFHTSLLHLYHEMWEHRVSPLPPAPELIEGEPKWEVEAILASRQHRCSRKLQYLIKWKGYPKSDTF